MRVGLLLLTACAATACGDAIRVVKQTVALQEAFHRQIDRRSPTPQMRDRLRALARSGAGDSVQMLVAHGLVRLDDATLIRRMELMSVMLEESDVPICAAIARGTPGSGQMTLAMAELEGRPPTPTPAGPDGPCLGRGWRTRPRSAARSRGRWCSPEWSV